MNRRQKGDSVPVWRVALFQPALPHYRVALFNELNRQLGGGLVVYSEAPHERSGLLDGTGEIRAEIRASHTYRVGPFWVVPRSLRQVADPSWSAVVLSWNARQVELLFALLIGRMRGVPVYLWGHGVGRSGSRMAKVLRRWQAKLAVGVLTYSARGGAAVERLAPGVRVTVVPNTTGRQPPGPDDMLGKLTMRIGYVGRLDPRKRLDRLIEAVSLLDRRGLRLDVAIMGDGPCRARLGELAADLGVAERVHFAPGSSSWPAVREHLRSVDVVVFPEAAGLGVVDSFAAARPVVVLDHDDANDPPEADNVRHGVTGARYGTPTVVSLADTLALLYEDPRRLTEMSRAAANHHFAHLTLSGSVTRFAMALKQRASTGAGRV